MFTRDTRKAKVDNPLSFALSFKVEEATGQFLYETAEAEGVPVSTILRRALDAEVQRIKAEDE